MDEKIPCRDCGKLILTTTAARNDGLCMPCKGGYRANIEAGKVRAQEHKRYLASPQARYWQALVHRVYDGGMGFAGLSLAEQHYYAVSVLVGEVYNGGFDQYFSNSSGEHYANACAGLRELAAVQTLALLEQAKHLLFADAPVPSDQGQRQLQMLTSDEVCSAALDALDTRFYADSEQLDTSLLAYARQHALFEVQDDE